MTSSPKCPVLGAPFETIPVDEVDNIDETVALGISLQDKRAQNDKSQGGKLLRGVHAKSHGCVKAEFTIRKDIKEQYQVGLFAHPGRVHEAWIRFSNAAVLREDDLKADDKGVRQNGSRGMAIKVVNVDGEMLSDDDGHCNQDFLMVNTPMFAFANVRDYLRLDRILALDELGADPGPYFLPLKLAALGDPQDDEPTAKSQERSRLKAIMEAIPAFNEFTPADFGGTKTSFDVITTKINPKIVRNPMQVQYFGAAPFLFGPGQAMKFSAAPCVVTEQMPFEEITDDNPSKDYLREALGETMNCSEDVCFDFMIQTRSAEADDLNIEDATTTWPDEENSYVKVAQITIKVPQTPHCDDELAHCEKLAFNPWHSLAAHQPLGGINRLRRKVYFESADHRGGCR